MPLSVHYTPKMWIIRHKILCPGSIKMCMVITKHILVVKQLGNEGKKKGRKHIEYFCTHCQFKCPSQLTPSKCQHAIGHGWGHYLHAQNVSQSQACFNFQPHYFLEYVHVFLTCVHVCLRLFFFFEMLNPYLIKHLTIPSYEIP